MVVAKLLQSGAVVRRKEGGTRDEIHNIWDCGGGGDCGVLSLCYGAFGSNTYAARLRARLVASTSRFYSHYTQTWPLPDEIPAATMGTKDDPRLARNVWVDHTDLAVTAKSIGVNLKVYFASAWEQQSEGVVVYTPHVAEGVAHDKDGILVEQLDPFPLKPIAENVSLLYYNEHYMLLLPHEAGV